MTTGDSIVIHASAIIQQGLKSILLARGFTIRCLLSGLPCEQEIARWKDTLILADTQFGNDLRPLVRRVTRNGNRLIGIGTVDSVEERGDVFGEIICTEDTPEVLQHKIHAFILPKQGRNAGNRLTHRETAVLSLVAQGLSNKLIAAKLFISIHTVITHRKNITTKLGIRSIPGLTLYAVLNDLVEPQP